MRILSYLDLCGGKFDDILGYFDLQQFHGKISDIWLLMLCLFKGETKYHFETRRTFLMISRQFDQKTLHTQPNFLTDPLYSPYKPLCSG